MIRLDDTIAINDSLMAADLDGEMVLLDTQSGVYFGLNPVGARIWELASEPYLVQEMIDVLANEYAVEKEKLEEDVLSFVNSLYYRSLVHVIATVEV